MGETREETPETGRGSPKSGACALGQPYTYPQAPEGPWPEGTLLYGWAGSKANPASPLTMCLKTATRNAKLAYMPEEIIKKLTAQLKKGITTEVQVVYLLVGIRKLLERDGQKSEYSTLNFYCDWVVHSKLDRSGAENILRDFDKAHPLRKDGMDLPPELHNKIRDIYGMRSFEKELQSFLKSYDLPPIAEDGDGRSRFFYLYGQVIHDIPLMVKSSSNAAVENISKIAVHCETATETIKLGDREECFYKIVWEVFDKTEGSGRYESYNSFDIAAGFKPD